MYYTFEMVDEEASFSFEEVMQKVISTFLVLSFLVPPLKRETHIDHFPLGGLFGLKPGSIDLPSFFGVVK